MKKVILFVFVLAGLNGYAQDFKINSNVKYSKGVISLPPNKIILNYHHVSRVNDSVWLYQPQFFTEDSLGHRLPPQRRSGSAGIHYHGGTGQSYS